MYYRYLTIEYTKYIRLNFEFIADFATPLLEWWPHYAFYTFGVSWVWLKVFQHSGSWNETYMDDIDDTLLNTDDDLTMQ
jgi:hypothetical protein